MKNQLVWAFALLVLCMLACKAENANDGTTNVAVTANDTSAAMAPAEFADPKYSRIVSDELDALSRGDIPAMMSAYADNAVFAWNSGDSIAGKQAITDYWTKRRGEVIESLTYGGKIFLPLKVNKPQSIEAPGIWVLSWHETTAKYKASGKTMTQWIHSDVHFDANDKIDRWIQYIDRSLIIAAETK